MDESINGTLNQILDYIGGCEDFRNNAQLRTYLERLTKKEARSSVSSSAGLEGLLEWAIKEREKLEAYAERNGSRYLDPSTWGSIDMIVKVENKIAELRKAYNDLALRTD